MPGLGRHLSSSKLGLQHPSLHPTWWLQHKPHQGSPAGTVNLTGILSTRAFSDWAFDKEQQSAPPRPSQLSQHARAPAVHYANYSHLQLLPGLSLDCASFEGCQLLLHDFVQFLLICKRQGSVPSWCGVLVWRAGACMKWRAPDDNLLACGGRSRCSGYCLGGQAEMARGGRWGSRCCWMWTAPLEMAQPNSLIVRCGGFAVIGLQPGG